MTTCNIHSFPVGLAAVVLATGALATACDRKYNTTAEPMPSDMSAMTPEIAATTEITGAELSRAGGTTLPPFEGELQVDTKSRAPGSLTYAMKGDKIRLGFTPTTGKNKGAVDAIVDTGDKKAYVLLNDKKQYVEVDLGDMAKKAVNRLKDLDIHKTGISSNVAGRSCEEWVIKDKSGQVRACVAKGAPMFDLDVLEQQANFTAPGWVHTIVDEGYIPLRVSIADARGTPMMATEVTDASRKVDDAKFAVPSEYKKIEATKLRPAH